MNGSTKEDRQLLASVLLEPLLEMKRREFNYTKFVIKALRGEFSPREIVVEHILLMSDQGVEIVVPRIGSTAPVSNLWAILHRMDIGNTDATNGEINAWVRRIWRDHVALTKSLEKNK